MGTAAPTTGTSGTTTSGAGSPARGSRRPYTPRKPAGERREQLLDAALEIISRDGYHAVSIEAIARSLNVTRPVVYNVFDGLEDLLSALLDRQERRALAQLAASVSLDVDLGDLEDLGSFITRTVHDLTGMVRADPSNWRLIFLTSTGTPEAVRTRIDRDRELVRRQVCGAVELAVAARLIAPTIDPGIVSHAFIALGEYFGRMLVEDPSSVDAASLASTVGALLGAGPA